ncbi:KTSC domain-containing protein [Sphingomonas xinjiangensis]|uniref:KTSC domain-containing protein n=1 Tax=Sphingomonas xinjiangensis TaxID=643568 RepID=A0A840YLB5_9SPHN|nr:KTSC domain-containing protein [Sphingomonas xinjiangensis]MBB5710206.1 hypothetical protein [Sphingomonas xinjiangensis]
MRPKRLNSSIIDRVVFDDDAQTLLISFKQSGRYLYSGVPRAIYDALGKAASAGTYFNQCIKGQFPCRPERRRHRPGG